MQQLPSPTMVPTMMPAMVPTMIPTTNNDTNNDANDGSNAVNEYISTAEEVPTDIQYLYILILVVSPNSRLHVF
jgi:hypothetical protein